MTTVLSFIVVLGFLVFVHELGHYLAARHVGVKVLTFSIGFPPKAFGKRIGDTDYIVSWIPLGGYVRLHGQNLDDEDPNDPENYASKSILERFYILVAGPLMNLVVAFLLMPLVYLIGINTPKYFEAKPIVSSVAKESFAETLGVKRGDIVVAVNGTSVQTWEAMTQQMLQSASESVILEVSRDGNLVQLEGTIEQLKVSQSLGLLPKIDPVVGGFSDNSPAREAGLQIGDRLSKINGVEVQEWKDIASLIQASQKVASQDSETPQPLSVEYVRNNQIQVAELTPRLSKTTQTYLLGITIEQTTRQYNLVTALAMGTERLIRVTEAVFYFFVKLFSGNGSLDDMGGPLRIAKVVGDAAQSSIAELLFLMSAISLQLGIFNLLPLPVLDGGHILFLIVERFKGEALSPEFREKTQAVGVTLLIALTLVITYNDILQLFFS